LDVHHTFHVALFSENVFNGIARFHRDLSNITLTLITLFHFTQQFRVCCFIRINKFRQRMQSEVAYLVWARVHLSNSGRSSVMPEPGKTNKRCQGSKPKAM
jgi:hypothetical protein